MDETAWLNATDPAPMLEFLRGMSGVSQRKLRLFAVGCCRRLLCLTGDEQVHKAVEFAERQAAGLARRGERGATRKTIFAVAEGTTVISANNVAWAAYCATAKNATRAADDSSRYAAAAAGCWAVRPLWPGVTDVQAAQAAERAVQCALLRDIVGNPFAPLRPIEAAWLRWNDGTVRRIAEAIYDGRRWGDMPVLADALLDAGCTDENMLAHCRQQEGVHARGCWVVDLLLNKE